ncbi:hypothetical protein BCY91_15860 [Pelobium manganitolerans]|uniref:Acyltransferase 3 domain-containing protein n=1 Tax=Pelobium manganitolerans TaxID=1842495 RepID=A0A419S8M6_9SPHI|nr:acyltransferase [Pelobium manganitolerans]RKD18276.1 hypothetical protein BCY91_15860 [Pelobium manganitolerans]
MRYIKPLDSLRALAVMLVVCSHWLGANATISKLSLGLIGVNIFFVLSGYLITNNLLLYKKQLGKGLQSTGFYIKKFYYRRFLRIVPVYFLLLLVVYAFNIHDFRGTLWWHLLYLSNFYFVFVKEAWEGAVSHLWSLSVEEQFYIFWPFLILFLRSSWLKALPIVLIVLAVVYRFFKPAEYELWNFTLFGSLDALALGSLIAIYKIEKIKVKWVATILACVLLLAWLNYQFQLNQFLLCVNLIAFLLVISCKADLPKAVKYCLEIPFVLYIGRISYGIYLYHNFIPRPNLDLPKPLLLFIQLAILIAISALSYRFIEAPLLKLKNRKFNSPSSGEDLNRNGL